MRSLPLVALLALPLWPSVATADLRVSNGIALTRGDGTVLPVAQKLRVWCGPWEPGVPPRAIHIRAGAVRTGPFWQVDAVVADVKRDPIVRFPHSFVFDEPTGALLFAVDGATNEASTAEEEASGRIEFTMVRCGRRLKVRFRVDATLGSEFIDGEELRMRGSFRASK